MEYLHIGLMGFFFCWLLYRLMVSAFIEFCIKFATLDTGLNSRDRIGQKLGLGYWNNKYLILIAGSFG